ncbi:hypothetical protein CYY_008914 [Polysphondylium violaceum]|uniref:Peptide chain release factor N(5)-glutamine methyltransferase n=1 Tax=Polysphondylium violaceum TaxID=133409 RepID=A0A8J4PKZ7_9MYCE|nr:hypothetical protein CYY_008914 [Polysphondylium violaceum]
MFFSKNQRVKKSFIKILVNHFTSSSSSINNKSLKIKDVLKETRDKLNTCSNKSIVDSSDLDSRLLVSDLLGFQDSKSILLLNRKQEIDSQQYEKLQSFINKRLQSEPISYILGYKYFWKHKFNCNSSTLIPRPDSEILIETILELKNEIDIKRVLDLGTGTGCLLLSVLDEIKDSQGFGIDQSNDALDVAKQNSIDLQLSTRSTFINANWNDINQFPVLEPFDIIISNPPYISFDEYNTLNDTVKKFEPKSALIAKENGLQDYRIIGSLIRSRKLLNPNGFIVFEIGKDQHLDIENIMKDFGFTLYLSKKDLSGIIRCLIFK